MSTDIVAASTEWVSSIAEAEWQVKLDIKNQDRYKDILVTECLDGPDEAVSVCERYGLITISLIWVLYRY